MIRRFTIVGVVALLLVGALPATTSANDADWYRFDGLNHEELRCDWGPGVTTCEYVNVDSGGSGTFRGTEVDLDRWECPIRSDVVARDACSDAVLVVAGHIRFREPDGGMPLPIRTEFVFTSAGDMWMAFVAVPTAIFGTTPPAEGGEYATLMLQWVDQPTEEPQEGCIEVSLHRESEPFFTVCF